MTRPQASAARAPGQRRFSASALARSVIKSTALHVVGFVIARPALDAFLRRQIFRFPGLAGQIRAAIARTRRANQTLPTIFFEEADLTDDARQVLLDLKRTLHHVRQP